MVERRDNNRGGSSNGAPPRSLSLVPPESSVGAWIVGYHTMHEAEEDEAPGPRRDLQYARQCVTALIEEYVYLAGYCQDVHAHRLTLRENERDTPAEVLPVAREVNKLVQWVLGVLGEAMPVVATVMTVLDAHSRGPVTIGDISTTNAHAAIVRLGMLAEELFKESGMRILPFDQQENDNAVHEWTRTLRHGTPEFVTLMATETPEVNGDELLATVRIEHAAAISSLPQSSLSDFEKIIVACLRDHAKPITGDKLLTAAGLNVTGSNKALLANARERGVLTNNPPHGYGLPEWNSRQ